MKRMMNVLIVPDEGGPARRLNVPTYLVRFAAWLILLILIGLAIAFFSYARFLQKAFDWDRLSAENERLREENRRILRVTNEVEDSRQLLVKIIRSMQGEEAVSPNQAVAPGGEPIPLSDEAIDLLKRKVQTPEIFLREEKPSLLPIKGFISQRYLEDPLFSDRSHRGVDIAGRMGAPVVAAASGRVIFEGWTITYGKCLMIAHAGGYLTFYGHNRMNLKKTGDEVKRGEPVALLGTTGVSTAPHVHFEVWKDGSSIDPLKVLKLD